MVTATLRLVDWATRPWSVVVGLLVVAALLALMGVWVSRRR